MSRGFAPALNPAHPGPHEARIRELMSDWPGVERHRFAHSVRRALDNKYLQGPGCIPDAFFIDAPNRNVVVFEIVHKNPVSQDKIDQYCGYWWGIDGCDWDLILVTVYTGWRPAEGVDIGDIATAKMFAELGINTENIG